MSTKGSRTHDTCSESPGPRFFMSRGYCIALKMILINYKNETVFIAGERISELCGKLNEELEDILELLCCNEVY